MAEYISDIITDEDLQNILPGRFNVLRAPRGYGKTTFCFDDRILKFARSNKHVLYLIHNKLTRNYIANNHQDKAIVFSDCSCNGWFANRKKGVWTSEEDVDKVQVMCYQTFAALLRNEGTDWLDDIDLIVWDEFDDIKSFYEKEVKTIKKLLPDFSRERLVSILQEGRSTSVVNFVYQLKICVLDPARIKFLAVSATPESAAYYFRDYINYIINGKLEEKFYAQNTIYIDDVISAIENGIIQKGKKYWCFTRFITDAMRIVEICKKHDINGIALWSEDNVNWRSKMTDERKAAIKMIREKHIAPPQYDMIIITAIGSRGIDIYDYSIQDWICDSSEYEDLAQFVRARFPPERQYLLKSARGLVEFIRNGFFIDYYEWHTRDELKTLLEEKPIFSNKISSCKKLTTFSAVLKEYPDLFEKRIYGKKRLVQYRIKPAE